MNNLPPEALDEVAAYFQALGEPTRLAMLNLLRGGSRNVGELAEATGFSLANVSRHLSTLTKQGLVTRESRGTSVYYSIADASVYQLCDLVCGNIGRRLKRTARSREAFVRRAPRGKSA